VVIGGQRLTAAAAAEILCRAGARAAVAMDQSGCAMMGAYGRFMVGPPGYHRQAMQTYGLCCRR
jgi:hypothetical protein